MRVKWGDRTMGFRYQGIPGQRESDEVAIRGDQFNEGGSTLGGALPIFTR